MQLPLLAQLEEKENGEEEEEKGEAQQGKNDVRKGRRRYCLDVERLLR